MDHLDGRGILVDIEPDGEGEPLAAALHGFVVSGDLDHHGDGTAALHLGGEDVGLEFVVGDDPVGEAGTVLGPGDQPAAGDDLVPVHLDVVDELVAALGEGNLIETVVDVDPVVIVAQHEGGPGHGLLPGQGPQGLLVGLDGLELEIAGLAGTEGGVEAHPLDAAVVPARQHPVLGGDDVAGGVGEGEAALLVHRALGEGDAPALAEVVGRSLVDPVQVDRLGVQCGRGGQRCEKEEDFSHKKTGVTVIFGFPFLQM